MTKQSIRADQVCVGDIFNGAFTIEDLTISGNTVTIDAINMETGSRIHRTFDQWDTITVDTDYLDRIFSEWDAEDVNVDVEDVPDVDFGEDVEDLLDH